jgi:hypothetical protein
MRRLFLLIIPLLLATCLSACGTKPQEFKSGPGKFSVMTTIPLKETTQDLESEGGKIKLYLFAGQEGNIGYFVSYCDYPPEVAKPDKAEQMLDGARNGAVSNARGKLVSETKVSLGDNPGRELVIDAVSPHELAVTIKGRLFMVKNRLYQIMVVSPRGEAGAAGNDAFLKSFKLLDQ